MSTTSPSTHDLHPDHLKTDDLKTDELKAELRRRLLALRYEAFAHCLCTLLGRLGYRDVRPAGRTAWRGRNQCGGHDIEASVPAGVASRRVIAQLKQYALLPVHQRQVDELRGACLRAGAAEALLITTAGFSQVVQDRNTDDARSGGLIAPVRLIGGGELLELMAHHRVGVRENHQGRGLHVDAAFFRDLAERFPGRPERERPTDTAHRMERWNVMVEVTLPPHGGKPPRPGGACPVRKEDR